MAPLLLEPRGDTEAGDWPAVHAALTRAAEGGGRRLLRQSGRALHVVLAEPRRGDTPASRTGGSAIYRVSSGEGTVGTDVCGARGVLGPRRVRSHAQRPCPR